MQPGLGGQDQIGCTFQYKSQCSYIYSSIYHKRNKNGDIEHYTDLEMQTGDQRVWLQFFLTDLADQKAILGYPWFTANQPKIDWAQGWIDSSQLVTGWLAGGQENRQDGRVSTFDPQDW